MSCGFDLKGALQQAAILTAADQGTTLSSQGPLAVLHLLQCIRQCHGRLPRMVSMVPRMRTLYYSQDVHVSIMHNNTFPTIANISETNKTQARTARCYPPRLSHCGDGPAKHGSSGFFASLHTHIYRCQGLHWRSWCYFLPFPTGSRWRTAPWLSRSGRDLQTDIVRVRAGLQLDGHMLRQQRVGIDQSH